MPPGGTKRVRAIGGSEATPGVATRSGKKYITNHPTVMAEGQSTPLPENNETATVGQGEEEHPPSPVLGFSVFDDPNNTNEDEVTEELDAIPQGK